MGGRARKLHRCSSSYSSIEERELSEVEQFALVIIRTAGIEDLKEVKWIEDACFQDERYSTEVLSAMLLETGFDTLLAEIDGPAGSATVNYRNDLVAAQLVSIAVLPQYRGRGLAQCLLMEAEERVRSRGARRIVLQVEVVNVPAINLYLHRGYVIEGMIGDYYGPGRDAFLMQKDL